MPDLQVKVRTGGETTVKEQAIGTLKETLKGRILTPDSGEYDEVRSIWNAMIDRRPALIIRCANDADVVQAVRFARDHKLIVAVRSGGHNIAGNAVCDGGVMIDLSMMRSVHVDPTKRIAQVEAGATLGDFDSKAQAYGLATPLGINSTTGVAGLTLGGGFGWLSRKLGLTIDNLLSADVVTAEGALVKASAAENSDLFWAIRGGGGNFGIVTSFEFRVHEIGPDVLAGLIIHPFDAARDVLRFYRDFTRNTPDELSCWFVLRKAPPLPFLPSEWHGKEILALAVCYSGKISDGERLAKPLRDFGHPLADVIAPTPFTAWQTVLDPLLTKGMRNYWKSHDFLEVSDGLIDVLLEYTRRIPDPQTEIAFVQLGGAISRIPLESTAYAHRDARFLVNVHGRWDNPANDAKCIAWSRELFQAASPFATGGVYVNFLTQDEQDRVHSAYSTNYGRLVQVKNKYDPTNFFRLNQNIQPTV
jgi:FAD/FMN-containing dehydrogenase